MGVFEKVAHTIEFDHCSGDPTQKESRTLNQYVDDQSNGAVKAGDDASKCVSTLEENENLSNDLLNVSGRGGNFLKSFCYIIEQVPKENCTGWQILTM